jgi:hypothetical protein
MNTRMVADAGIRPISTVEEGADAILSLAVGPQHAGTTGTYFNGLKEGRALDQAYEKAARARLRETSLRLTGLAGR